MDYDQIADSIRDFLAVEGINIKEVHFDKHMITHFQAACARASVLQESEWIGVPQYFRDMGVRLSSVQGLMLQGRLRHGGHPLLNYGASNAIAVQGREGVSALDKKKSTARIDMIVAMTMACWPLGEGRPSEQVFDVASLIV